MDYYKHQLAAIERGAHQNLGLIHEPGCGKTLTALTIAMEHDGPALVVCPLSIIESSWIADAKKFFPYMKVVNLHTTEKKRAKLLASDFFLAVVNYATFRNRLQEIRNAKPWNVMIVDESVNIKNPKAKITKAVLEMARDVPWRYILSGIPAPNNESEYWSQVHFLAPGRVFSDSYWRFMHLWFVNRGKTIPCNPKRRPSPCPACPSSGRRDFSRCQSCRLAIKTQDWVLKPHREKAFREAMYPYLDVVRKADALDLPPKLPPQVRVVSLAPKERKAYKEMEAAKRVAVDGGQIKASNVLAQTNVLRQLAGGGLYVDGKPTFLGESKLKELAAVLNEIGNSPVVIFASFVDLEINRIQEYLSQRGYGPVAVYHGKIDPKVRRIITARFQEGDIRCLVANPACAGHGLTLTKASHVVYYSLSYSYDQFSQSQDRIHRIGQESPCTYWVLQAEKTIDEVVYSAVMSKRDASEAVLEYLRRAH